METSASHSHSRFRASLSRIRSRLFALYFLLRREGHLLVYAFLIVSLVILSGFSIGGYGLGMVRISTRTNVAVHSVIDTIRDAASRPLGSGEDLAPLLNPYDHLSQCLSDLKFISGGVLPPIKRDSVRIPFYVYEEDLPNEHEVKWSHCYSQFLDTPMHNKKLWSYYLAKQLEDHPWRVRDPADALLFIIPYLDFGMDDNSTTVQTDPACEKIFVPAKGLMSKLFRLSESFPDVDSSRQVLFVGSYLRRRSYRQHYQRLVSDYGAPPEWLKLPTISFTSAVSRLSEHANQKAMPVNVDGGVCYEGKSDHDFVFKSIPDRLNYCEELENRLENHSKLSHSQWLGARPFKYQSLGKFDNRSDYKNRKALTYAITASERNGTISPLLHPSYLLFNHQRRDKESGGLEEWTSGGIAEQCHADIAKLVELQDPRLLPDGIFCGGGMNRSWKKEIEGYPTVNWDIKTYSRMVLSLRGDSLGSQRSHEGMYYGSLTWHDQPLGLLGLTILPLPNLIPWRLTGLFDESECLKETVFSYYSSFMPYFSIENALKQRKSENLKMSEDEWEELEIKAQEAERQMIECTYSLPLLIESEPEVTTLMRKAIQQYRDDVLWETKDSRLAENLLFEIASDLDSKTLARFDLSPSDFEPQFPASCTANTTEVLQTIRGMNKEAALDYLLTLGDYDDIIGVWGKQLGA